jgi:hypothetical protein
MCRSRAMPGCLRVFFDGALAPKKTSRVHGTIQRTTRMLVFVARPDAFVELGHSSPPLPFSVRRVNAITSSTSRPAGAGISERSFAHPQQRFRHHCEVNVPDLRLRFHATNFRESVRLPTPSLRSVSRPIRGEILARSPFSAPICGALAVSPASTPLRVFSKPSGSKRSTGSTTRSSSPETPDGLSPKLKTRCAPLD